MINEEEIDNKLENIFSNNIQVQHGVKDVNELIIDLIKEEVKTEILEFAEQLKSLSYWTTNPDNKILREEDIDKLLKYKGIKEKL
jgi:hypothetical protein